MFFLFLVVFAGASLCAVEVPASATPKPGGTIRLAMEADPHSLDPSQIFSNEEAMLGFLMFNTLLESNPDGSLSPVLVESLPTTSHDGRIHTFRLRQGVFFSNGQELTADDVVGSFERFFDPKTEASATAYFRSIEGSAEFEAARKKEISSPSTAPPGRSVRWIEPQTVSGLRALDRYTMQIRLVVPDLSFLHILTSPSGCIVPRTEVDRAGRRFATQPIGTGRFILKQWTRGVRIRFARNPRYFRAELPGPDAVDVLVNVDRTTQGMMFERGEQDFQHYIADPDFVRINKDSKLQPMLQSVTGSSPTFVVLNCELPPFTNRQVRLAMNHAVNRDALVRLLMNRCVSARGPLPLVVRGFNRNLPEFRYDPPKARALLAEAGLTNGFETTLWTNRDDSRWLKIALFVQQSLREIGVTVNLKEVTYPALLAATSTRKTVPMCVWDWMTPFNDPKETLDSLLNGDKISEEACMNNAFYSNTRVQQFFRDADAELDATRRFAIFQQIEELIVRDAPWIFLVQLNTEMMRQPWLKGFQPRGFWPPARLENCWIER